MGNKKVRIQNDGGLGYTTKITEADTGLPIDHIFHARIVEIDLQKPLVAMLWSHAPKIDVIADAHIINQCPHCGQQSPDPKEISEKFRLNLTIEDTHLDLSIAKLQKLQRLQRSARAEQVYPAEALTAFIDWIECSLGKQSHTPDFLAHIAEEFCEAQGWLFDQEYYDAIIGRIKANYPD